MSTYKANKNQTTRQGLTYKKLLSTSALVAVGLFGLHTAPALADNSWGNLNQDAGSFTTDITDPNVTNIVLGTDRAIGSGNADIYLGDTVNVDGALFVVRDTRADPTRILGNLNSNGKVIIIDDNGIFFGTDSVVDVAGLVATTGHIGNADIMDGNGHFDITDLGNASIDMRGTINIADSGLAAFVAPTVVNSGVINARLGTVAFAAGKKVTLDMYGDGLFEVAVDGEIADALLENTTDGEINAEGGTVTMTASAAKDVVNDIINLDGVVNVSSATVKGGKIILSGGDNGTVKLSGKLDASGTAGGDINVTGQTVEITQDAEIINGDESNSYVFGTDKAIFRGSLQAGANATAEISGKELVLGGTIDLDDGSTISFDPIIFTVGAGEAATIVSALNNNNVTVDVEAEQRIILNADIDTSAQTTNSVLNFKDENADNALQVNLNAEITMGAAQDLTGDATFIDVSNGSALIQNGIDIAASGATVELDAGVYNENISIDKTLTLISEDGRDLTSINGVSGVGALGTVVVEQGVTGVQIGDTDTGIHIVGIDNGNPGVENAAVYLQGLNNDTIIKGNEIEAAGEFALRTEYALAYDNIQIDSNIFSGKTYVGATSATGDQFTVPNVARALVYIGGPDKTNISFTNNTVTGDAGDARLVSLEGDTVTVTGNIFAGTTSGVDLRLRGVNVVASANNFIGNLSGAGIVADGVENLTIGGALVADQNTVTGYTNGISVIGGSGVTIIQNNVISNNTDTAAGRVVSNYTTGVGVIVSDTAGIVTVSDNTTTGNTDGIRLIDTDDATVSGNTVFVNTDNGIITNASDNTQITENVLNGNGIGVYLDNSVNALVQANTINGSNQDGIHLLGATTSADIKNNFITGSGSFGLLASGSANGAITLAGNTFTDNPTGARFESGIIDISDLTNPNIFTNTDAAAAPVGLQFDEVGVAGSLSLAGETIGATEFNGFTNPGSFYVRIEDGALLDTVANAPIVINGLDASFDSFVPNSVGGVLTQAQFDALEDRIFDADDASINGRGQLLVDFVPDLGLDNLQDFFNQFGGFPPGFSGFNVLIRNAADPAAASALNFANIQPAAGEGVDENGEGVADIEPAAGEEAEDASCWNDALSATGTVSYNFGGSFEESLADAASCGS